MWEGSGGLARVQGRPPDLLLAQPIQMESMLSAMRLVLGAARHSCCCCQPRQLGRSFKGNHLRGAAVEGLTCEMVLLGVEACDSGAPLSCAARVRTDSLRGTDPAAPPSGIPSDRAESAPASMDSVLASDSSRAWRTSRPEGDAPAASAACDSTAPVRSKWGTGVGPRLPAPAPPGRAERSTAARPSSAPAPALPGCPARSSAKLDELLGRPVAAEAAVAASRGVAVRGERREWRAVETERAVDAGRGEGVGAGSVGSVLQARGRRHA